jgi:ribosomal-protein-alanine N-acetyltransferase
MIELDHRSPAAAHWSRQQYECLFAADDSGSAQRFLLIAEEIAEDADQMPTERASAVPYRMLAFLVAHRVDNEWELENIVVAEESRRRGIGTHLLGELIDHARSGNGNAIYLEVRESNQTARELYCKVGFEETGSRKGYYATPPEDAILYRLSLY